MTDNEFIKVLECCKKAILHQDCLDLKCPYAMEFGCNIDKENLRNMALDLINRLKANDEKNENVIRLADKTIEKQSKDIEEQQAEIERLTTEIDQRNEMMANMGVELGKAQEEIERLKDIAKSALNESIKVCDSILNAKSEAYKEFAEKLKVEALIDSGFEVLPSGTIDRILAEMVGDNNVQSSN